MARHLKEALDVPIVVGGHHISQLPWRLPQWMDVGVVGEGEVTFLELCRSYQRHGGFAPDELGRIKGIAYHADGQVLVTERRPLVKPLDLLPPPDRRPPAAGGTIGMCSSRGCPFRCVFCACTSFWRRYRMHSAARVVSEISDAVERYGIRGVAFVDDLVIASGGRLLQMRDLLRERGLLGKIAVHSATVQASMMNREVAALISELGFKSVFVGVESGSPRILSYLKSGAVTVEQNQQTIDLCHEYGIACYVAVIFGTPGETLEDMQRTYDFIEKNRDRVISSRCYHLIPTPGTPLWEQSMARGLVSEDMDWDRAAMAFASPNFHWATNLYLNEDTVPLEQYVAFVRNYMQMAGIRYDPQALNEPAPTVRSAPPTVEPRSDRRDQPAVAAATAPSSQGVPPSARLLRLIPRPLKQLVPRRLRNWLLVKAGLATPAGRSRQCTSCVFYLREMANLVTNTFDGLPEWDGCMVRRSGAAPCPDFRGRGDMRSDVAAFLDLPVEGVAPSSNDELAQEWVDKGVPLNEEGVTSFYAATDKYLRLYGHGIGDRFELLRPVLDFVGVRRRSHRSVLDYGCGVGALVFWLAQLGYDVAGADVSSPHFEFCRWRFARYGLRATFFDVSREPLGGRYDAITCFETLEHILDWRKALADMARCLKPGGRVFLTISFGSYRWAGQEDVLHIGKTSGLSQAAFAAEMERLGLSLVRDYCPPYRKLHVWEKARVASSGSTPRRIPVLRQAPPAR
jgi:radical SAM superfamily enzyme YgiQ (UPF0313 family)/SAM-dependent methyltransferase